MDMFDKFNKKDFSHELLHHAPFTFFATLGALVIVILFTYFFQFSVSKLTFEITHLVHLLVSSMVTAGLFFIYKPKVIPALLIGIFGAILIGSLSDIFFPFLSASLMGAHVHFHLPVLEIPLLVFLTALAGSLLGMLTSLTRVAHFIHVFLSVFSSLFYLLAFTSGFSFWYFLLSFIIVFFAVIIPCCVSDILFPFFFLGKEIPSCSCKKK
jgi:hypothetical protein